MLTSVSWFLPLQLHCSQFLQINEVPSQMDLHHPNYPYNDPPDERRPVNNLRTLRARKKSICR
jgi:hypothetical protein